MKNSCLHKLPSILLALHLTWLISCSGKPGKPSGGIKEPATNYVAAAIFPKLINMKAPEENSAFRIGDRIKISIEPEDKSQLPDSVAIYFDGRKAIVMKTAPWEYSLPSEFTNATGRKSLKAVAYRGSSSITSITRFVIVMSDVIPKKYGYRIVHTYPHDKDAFTQGLFYDKGLLYEGTGQEASSTLREVDLETGKVLRQLDLSSNLFGEGITLYKDRIFQVTWRSKVGFVYDKATFRQINKIYYDTEGWGLTTVGDRIAMSDGTNVIYFFEPEMFTVVSRIEVYDNEKKVDQLNELEYINGEIWANIWMTDLIARIDPVSGKVLGYINLKGILTDPQTDTSVNVLNGIAYDREGNRIFVTGKNWPELFEIKITE